MLSSLLLPLAVASLAHASVLPRQDSGQTIPSTAPADNSFNNGKPLLAAEPPDNGEQPPSVYGARDVDLPFGRLFHGNAKFFPKGQHNTGPDGDKEKWYPDGSDSAKQSACGIPDNAFSISKVAIHPYFLKYADLSRYCQQDVCISFWNEDGSSDMMLKVTDVCSTDPSDPTHCETPMDIKMVKTKMGIMQHLSGDNPPELQGDQYPAKVWWFFTKCWADGLVQPAYTDNWFSKPTLPNNLKWSQSTQEQQWKNNQAAYPAKGWQLYPNGAYNPKRDDTTSPALSDWQPGDQTPSWSPVAGGQGWGKPGLSTGSASNASPLVSNSTSSGTPAPAASSGAPSSLTPLPAGRTAADVGSGQPSGQTGGSGAATPPTSQKQAASKQSAPITNQPGESKGDQEDCNAEEL